MTTITNKERTVSLFEEKLFTKSSFNLANMLAMSLSDLINVWKERSVLLIISEILHADV